MSVRNQPKRALVLRERAVLLWVLCELDASEAAEALHAQSKVATVVGGLPTVLELSVPPGSERAALPDGPLSVRAIATDGEGELSGEVLVWVSGGYLSGLEYAWYGDDPPSDFPCPGLLRVE